MPPELSHRLLSQDSNTFTLAVDPYFDHTRPPPATAPPSTRIRNATGYWECGVPLDLAIASPPFTYHLGHATQRADVFGGQPTKILGSLTFVSEMGRCEWFPQERLQALEQGVPYVKFFNLGNCKVEIELLCEGPHAWGIKFCLRDRASREWSCMSCLIAPSGIKAATTKPLTSTLRPAGTKRVASTEGPRQGMLEAAYKGEYGKLDLLLHPFPQPRHPPGGGGGGGGGGGSSLFSRWTWSRNAFEILYPVEAGMWVCPTDACQVTARARVLVARQLLTLTQREAALRSHDIDVYRGFEEVGVRVVEPEVGRTYTVQFSARRDMRSMAVGYAKKTRQSTWGLRLASAASSQSERHRGFFTGHSARKSVAEDLSGVSHMQM